MSDGGSASLPVAVIGGGYAGLAAALRLARAGVPVTLFERSGHLGGLAMTLPIGDTEIEKYYHHWFTSDGDVLALIAELGLSDRLRWASPVMGMFCKGAIYRFTAPQDLLRFRPFGFSAKVRFALVTLFLQHYPRREAFEGVTAAVWLRRYAGRTVYDTIWGPLLRAKFGRHAESISMAWIWSKMRLRGRSRKGAGTRESLGYLEGGFGVLTRALAAEIRRLGGTIHTAERVERVERLGDRFELTSARRREEFSAVVSTVAPPLLPELVPGLDADFRECCAAIEHGAILCTLLTLKRSFSPIYWMNISDSEIPFGGLIEHTNFRPPEAYGGRRILYISHYVYGDDPRYELDAEALFEHYRPGLSRIRSDFSQSWVDERHIFRDRFAQPIVTSDYHRRLPPIDAPLDGLFLATMSHVYPEDRGTNYAVRIGTAAAERAIARHERFKEPPERLQAVGT